jgi:hypothetical protein
VTERLLERLRAGRVDVALIAPPFDTGDPSSGTGREGDDSREATS